jgi:hypothetical protein
MRITGQQGIADMFGVSRETIDNWQQQGLPVARRGGPGVPSEYESADCISWRVASEVAKVQGESPNDRLARARAEEIEMRNAERRGLLIPAEQLEPKMKAAMAGAREAWLHDSRRISRDLQEGQGGDIEALLEEAFSAFLLRLSRWPDVDVVDDEDADA